MLLAVVSSIVVLSAPALPNARQLEFMELEISQFMHFNVDTAWDAPDEFLRGNTPTFHNCNGWSTGTSHDYQTEGTYPCLNATIFNPKSIDTDSWMQASAALGVKEVCLTAKHAGGFTMWPSKHTPYGIHAASNFHNGNGDIMRDFVASAKKWGIAICYYLNPMTDGYLVMKMNVTKDEYIAAQHGMLREVLEPGSPWGPVNRLWFDGVLAYGGSPGEYFQPEGLRSLSEYHAYYDATFALIRELSPQTIISAYRGDVCSRVGSLYTSDGPEPNSTDSTECAEWNHTETGKYFHPIEYHGVTMQEGPDGNTAGARPTYWFWHPKRVCALNATECPWVGHSNASRLFDGYIETVGRGGNLNANIAPNKEGLINASVIQVMADTGKAINDTFKLNDAGKIVDLAPLPCSVGAVVLDVSGPFDYVLTMEDMRHGQRVANYSIEYKLKGSTAWAMLVPPLYANASAPASSLGDRPDGNDPRDQYVGRKRIDIPLLEARGLPIEQVRFNCNRLAESVDADDKVIHLRQFSVHRKLVPWE